MGARAPSASPLQTPLYRETFCESILENGWNFFSRFCAYTIKCQQNTESSYSRENVGIKRTAYVVYSLRLQMTSDLRSEAETQLSVYSLDANFATFIHHQCYQYFYPL